MPVNLGTAYAEIKLKTDGFSSGIKQASGQLDEFKNKAGLVADGFTAAGTAMTKAGSSLTKTVTTPIVALGTAAVKTTATFDQSMSKVAALSGATGKNFDSLRDKAIEMGAKTSFSASEAADAFGYMALAGWKTEDMLSGIEGILNLAAASQMDLAQASDLVTDYLSAFGLEAKDSARMANELAYAQANSNMTTEQIGEAFKNSASQMNTAGQSMETTIGILGRLADQGLKGSEAGTALSATIRDITQKMTTFKSQADVTAAAEAGLVSVTGDYNDILGRNAIQIGDVLVPVDDLNGNFRDLTDILGDVEKATDGMGSAEKSAALLTTFTARSIKAVSMSLNAGTDDIKKFTDEVTKMGDSAYAAETAKKMLENLNGQITILKSALETLLIQIGDILMPTISNIVEKIRQLVVYFTSLDEEQKKQILRWAGIAAAIGPTLLVFGKVLTGIGSLIKTGSALLTWSTNIAKAFGLISSGASGITAGLSALASAAAPILAVVAAVVALGVAFKALYDQNGAFKESVDNLVGTLKDGLFKTIEQGKQAFEAFKEKVASIFEALKGSFDLEAIDGAMSKLVDALGAMLQALEPIATFLVKVIGGFIAAQLLPLISGVVGFINGIVKALVPLINMITDVINIIKDLANIITGFFEGIISGDFTKFNQAVSQLVEDVKQFFLDAFEAIKQFFIGFVEGFFVTFETFSGGLITRVAEFISGILGSIRDFFTVTIPDAFNNFVNNTLPTFIENVKTWFDQLPYNLGYALGQAIVTLQTWGQQALSWAASAIPALINKIIYFFQQLPGKIQTWLNNTIQKIKSWGEEMKRTATQIATSFVNNMVNLIKTLPDKIMTWINQIPGKIASIAGEMYNAGATLFNNLWNGMKAVWDSITGWFSGVVDSVRNFLQGIKDGMAEARSASEGSHADGLAYVPYNGYRATLHEGERVLTKNEAAAYNSGAYGGIVNNFYSPKAIDAYEANKLFNQTMRKMEEGFSYG